MIYAGIGSRETPDEVWRWMEQLGYEFAIKGYNLRSGGAPGADTAFEKGCDRGSGEKEIYLPWKNFNKNPSQLFNVTPEAIKLAETFYPNPKVFEVKPYIAKLMGRNCQQVFGENLDSPVDFVVCWTADGCESIEDRTKETGGTGQAISIASVYCIPVYNVKNDTSWNYLMNKFVLE